MRMDSHICHAEPARKICTQDDQSYASARSSVGPWPELCRMAQDDRASHDGGGSLSVPYADK